MNTNSQLIWIVDCVQYKFNTLQTIWLLTGKKSYATIIIPYQKKNIHEKCCKEKLIEAEITFETYFPPCGKVLKMFQTMFMKCWKISLKLRGCTENVLTQIENSYGM